jgi:predicted nucleic acid-binding Zn ribbon protein
VVAVQTRGKNFNRGKWQVERERLRLPDRRPPAGVGDASTIAAIIPSVMKQFGLGDQHWLETVDGEWPEMVGKDVAKHTRIGGITDKNLTVYVDNTVWLSELSRYGREKMLGNLQKRFGADRIRSVKLLLDPGR